MARLRIDPGVLALSTFFLALATLAAPPTRGQPPDSDRADLRGSWVLTVPVDRGRATIQSAFDRALARTNVFLRALARQRIDTDVLLARRIELAFEDNRIQTTFVTTAPHRFETRPGYPAAVRGENGQALQLTQTHDASGLQLFFEFDEGRRWTVLERHGERLRASTTIDPDRLEDNVRFVLHYRRAR